MKLNLGKWFVLSVVGLCALPLGLPLVWIENAANAQMADVPNPKDNGDFGTAFQRGNRGFYAIEKWLVVQPIDGGAYGYALNCRYTPNGQVRSRIARGAIITAVFKNPTNLAKLAAPNPSEDAIALDSRGLPWLRVRGVRDELAEPAKPVKTEQLGECYVRANLKYIAPINPDSLPSK